MNKIKMIVKNHKILLIAFSLIIALAIIFGMPTLAKLKNRNTIYTTSSWDGTIATSYKKGNGTKSDPYIISNGSEFAFFIEQLKNTDYAEKYFELSNDIIINAGTFIYDETNKLQYNLENINYSVKDNTNYYYDTNGNKVGELNLLSMINSFKGNLNGNSFVIYGIFLENYEQENLGLFKNLQGNISNLYIKNSVVIGKGDVSGLAVNSETAEIKNVVYDGFVINKSASKLQKINIELEPIISMSYQINSVLELPEISVEGNIKSIKLTGKYESSNEESVNTVTINGSAPLNNEFTIEMGTQALNEIPVTVTSTIDSTIITFSELIYQIEYYDDVTSGFISNSMDTVLNNVINKANLFGNYISAGFIGKVNGSLQMNRAYNTGNINAEYIGSGIVGEIKNNSNDIVMKHIYNIGNLNGLNLSSIIGKADNNTGNINIGNSINTMDNYPINTVNNSNVVVLDSYSLNGLTISVGNANGEFVQKTIEDIYNKESLKLLGYNEFLSFEDIVENESNVWIYEENLLPILYIDDLNNPIANLNINKYSWNNLSSELNHINIEKSLTFSIEEVSTITPIKEKYYYITSSKVPLTKENLENEVIWTQYLEPVDIIESGYYVIYAKIIDYDNKISYINSDIIALDISGKEQSINMGDYTWDSFKTIVEELYVNEEPIISIYAHDDLIPVNNIQYYVSQIQLSEEEIKQLTEWNHYNEPITITTKGKYIIYAKIVDVEQNVSYINTDFIIYNGYNQTITLGNENKNYNSNYITNKSLIRLNFESDFKLKFEEGYTHNLISNILLPMGTEVVIIDKNTNKIYKKIINTEDDIYGYNDSCTGVTSCSKYATYRFEEFKELGMGREFYYDESINYNRTITNENYSIIINFENTNIVENYYDVSFSLSIKDNKQKDIYKTLNKTINNINIYSTLNSLEITTKHKLNHDYNNQPLYFNSDSQLNINFSNSINYTMLNEKNIINTQYEKNKVGLLIKLYDSEGKEVNKKYLDNVLFELNNKEYFANSKNEIIINLGSATNENINTLQIKTKTNSSDLAVGTYYIKINNFVSRDGYYYNSLSEEQLIIPLIVDNEQINIQSYNFDVSLNKESIILNKNLETNLAVFNIEYTGAFINPIIKVSLYEKEKMTAYDQKYILVDLSNYTNDKLENLEQNKYNINILTKQFNLNLVPEKFNNNGYKYVFELYDGNKKITQVEKYFIVR